MTHRRTSEKKPAPPGRRLFVYIDGACKDNPGPAACGICVCDGDGQIVLTRGFYIGNATNNIAEYTGALRGLELVGALGADDIVVRSDSQLLVRQLNGEYKVRKPHLARLNEQVRQLASSFNSVVFKHITRESNKTADKLARLALKRRRDVVDLDDGGGVRAG